MKTAAVLLRTSCSLAVAVCALFAATGCENNSKNFALKPEFDAVVSDLQPTTLLGGKLLPESCVSPDGMALGPDGCIYVSITQRGSNWKHPAKIIRITPDDRVEDFFIMPVHEKTGKACPMGLAFDTTGDLYVADNQSTLTQEPGQSSLYRIVIKDQKAVRAEKVAMGINAANDVACWKNHVYVSDPDLRVAGENLSGVYRFAASDLKAVAPVAVTGRGDPRLVVMLKTENKAARGANGIDFDSKGRLYVNNFGDSKILRYTFNGDNGPVSGAETFASFDPQVVKTLDGMYIDTAGNLWTADIDGNAILKITPGGAATIVAKNDVSDGADGSLDTPSACLRRGNKLYISNIDLKRANSDHDVDPVQSISVLAIEDTAEK